MLAGTILTTVIFKDGWVIIRIVNPPPYWKVRSRYVTPSPIPGVPPAYGDWFDGPSGTGDEVWLRPNEQSSSWMEWQVIAIDPPEPAPVDPPIAEEPE